MKNDNIIIDGHSHIGNDYFHGYTDLNRYIELMNKTNIDYALLMPTPSPMKIINSIKAKYLGWYIHKNEILYYSDVNPNNLSNPYKEVNYELYGNVLNTDNKQLFFVPLVHPILDNVNYLESMLKELDPVAFKIHGIGEGIDPKNISSDFTDFIKKQNIPLIIHTDFDNGMKIFRYDTYLLRNLNRATKWIKYIKENKIKAVLNHGCALDKNAFNEINESNLIKVGLGPDLIIEYDVDRLNVNVSDKIKYLELLKKQLNNDKIIFDIDYNWNINPIKKQMDFEYLERINSIWNDNKIQRQIYSSNILSHFEKLKVKIKERRDV